LGSSGLHLWGTVDEFGWGSALGDAAGVCSVKVVDVKVGVELALKTAVARLQEAREGGPPALFQDGAVQTFDVPVGLRSAGADAGVAGADLVDRRLEAAAELVAVVGG
jgi:hypothetical protein